jgi:hypothetical protein
MVFQATPRIPVWAQLPVHHEEDMVPQFAPGMPGLRQDDDRMYVDLGGEVLKPSWRLFTRITWR